MSIAEHFAGGDGTEANPYIIKSKKQLEDFSSLVNSGENFKDKYIRLGDNIPLNDIPYRDSLDWDMLPSKYEWTAAGTSTKSFQGTFDGNNRVISGIYINEDASNQGLFGYLGKGGIIKNLIIENSYIKGNTEKQYIGGLVGYSSENTKISNCCFTGNVEGDDCVGSLAGGNNGGTYENCKASGIVKGNSNVGGLIGSNSGTISECATESKVEGSEDIQEEKYTHIGGLVGSNNSGTINNCKALGKSVSGTGCVGGLVGYNSGKIVNHCYASGNVPPESLTVGNFVGCNCGEIDDTCKGFGEYELNPIEDIIEAGEHMNDEDQE